MPQKAAPSQEETVNYLLCVIKSCVDFQPNFTQVAGEFGINTSRPSIDAQRRFKSIVEKAGFKLENGKQVTSGGTLTENPTVAASANAMGSGGDTPQTPKKSRKKIEPESSAKRRKINKGKTLEPDAEDEAEDVANGQKVS